MSIDQGQFELQGGEDIHADHEKAQLTLDFQGHVELPSATDDGDDEAQRTLDFQGCVHCFL